MSETEAKRSILMPRSGWTELPESTDLAMGFYRDMALIREFELRVNELFLRGVVPGTIHLSHGQEAAVVGACRALADSDFITMTHRPHGQALAKGIRPGPLLAEILGKVTGCCRGMGGSMHVGDMSVGALPAIAIVAAAIPIATGMAFAFKRRATNQIVCTFFGDGAVNKGEWHEAMNLAAIWDLPVVFLCENNVYASTTHSLETMRNDRTAERAAAYRIPGVTVDGNDPVAVYEAVAEAASRARDGGGPTFVECLTYRHGGHKRDDPGAYRPQAEVAAWMERDPVRNLRERLIASGRATEATLAAIDSEVEAEVDAAAEFALASPEPPVGQAEEFIYA